MDNAINSKQFQALMMYNIVVECMNDDFPETPFDEYGNKTFNAYKAVPEVSRYFLYQSKMFWINFRSWAALVISIISIAASILT